MEMMRQGRGSDANQKRRHVIVSQAPQKIPPSGIFHAPHGRAAFKKPLTAAFSFFPFPFTSPTLAQLLVSCPSLSYVRIAATVGFCDDIIHRKLESLIS